MTKSNGNESTRITRDLLATALRPTSGERPELPESTQAWIMDPFSSEIPEPTHEAMETFRSRFKYRQEAFRRHESLRNAGFPKRHIEQLATAGFSLPTTERGGMPYAHLNGICSRGGLVALVGDRGTGKTQAVVAAGVLAIVRDGRSASYVCAADLWGRYKHRCYQEGTCEESFFHSVAGPDILIIDELQVRMDTQAEDLFITRLIDFRYQRPDMSTIIVSNLKPDALCAALGRSVTSRLGECGRILEFNHINYRAQRRSA